jgi:hypothetical protein
MVQKDHVPVQEKLVSKPPVTLFSCRVVAQLFEAHERQSSGRVAGDVR